MKRVLYVRQDNNGDVLLQGPAIRAIATRSEVTLLCGPRGVPAARVLPGVADVFVNEAAWIDAEPQQVHRDSVDAFVDDIIARRFDEAVISTSFHQDPLPVALLLRMAGVARIGAISVDYPGSLLDVRHHVDEDIHEVVRALSLAHAMGYEVAGDDPMRMQIVPLPRERIAPFSSYVVVHPGATVPARAWSPDRNKDLVARLARDGYNVIV
ncbi:MAG: glycosyltransferase family 9 protein, partial [Candidatus Eremiobacteraeota bacterium]|nr:glycosyltransferase family 9 protein [Candidatus Eremiobacteraeota bacterium]